MASCGRGGTDPRVRDWGAVGGEGLAVGGVGGGAGYWGIRNIDLAGRGWQGAGMSLALSIRRAVPADVEVIADFNRRLAFETEHRVLVPETIESGVRAVLADATKGLYFVAEGEGRVVGQCSVTYEWSDWRNGNMWWIQSVYVTAGWRKRGVFRALYDQVRREAELAGVVGLRLYVEVENVAAQAAYARRGMVETSYRVFEIEFPRSGGS